MTLSAGRGLNFLKNPVVKPVSYTHLDVYKRQLQQLLDRFESGQDVSSLLLPVDSLFQDSPPVQLTPRQERACRDGAAFSLNLAPGTYRLYGASEFLALGRCDEGRMRTIKSFFEVN